MIYAVIDTNVFVSAFYTANPNSATSKIVDKLAHSKFTLLYNEEILAEYKDVLSREHFHISEGRRNTLFEFIRKNGVLADRTRFNDLFIDESDRVFYEVSLSHEDSFLVTGNLKHYPVTPQVVTPAQMIEILEKT